MFSKNCSGIIDDPQFFLFFYIAQSFFAIQSIIFFLSFSFFLIMLVFGIFDEQEGSFPVQSLASDSICEDNVLQFSMGDTIKSFLETKINSIEFIAFV